MARNGVCDLSGFVVRFWKRSKADVRAPKCGCRYCLHPDEYLYKKSGYVFFVLYAGSELEVNMGCNDAYQRNAIDRKRQGVRQLFSVLGEQCSLFYLIAPDAA